MKIHDRYCQGLRASSDSQRRTVAVEMDAQIPSATACRASSGQLHRDIGNPASAGGVQAAALTFATCTALNTGGRPQRCASRSDATPGAAHQRRRHLRTVSSHTRSDAAIRAVDCPSAAASTISRARHQTLLGAPGPDQAGQCTALRTGQRDPVWARR